MSSSLPPASLAALRAQGKATESGSGGFVNPIRVAAVKRILQRRGEPWAATVLGRSLERRSLLAPAWPWLAPGDTETLCLADQAEDDVAFARMTGGGS